jgi:hypothetical protein
MLGVSLALLPSCGHPTQLASISIQPTSVTVIGRGAFAPAQFTVFGQFVHPVETRDITKLVTWSTVLPEVATVDSNGLATSGPACGVTTITATAGHNIGVPFDSQAITVANATFTVADPSDPLCPQ